MSLNNTMLSEKKPIGEAQMLHAFIHMKNLKQSHRSKEQTGGFQGLE